MKKIILILIVSVLFDYSFAQKGKVKFGKVTEDELKMEYYEKDSSANAVVLYDYGKAYFQRGIIIERHKIIKILKDEGKIYADFGIPIFNVSYYPLRFMSFKASTYNYEKENIVETKLKNSEIIYE